MADAVDRLGPTPLRRLARPLRKAAAGVCHTREDLRGQLLYLLDEIVGHRQASQATALLTIAYAHELSGDQKPGLFATMSGPLDADLLNLVFVERSSDLLRGRGVRATSTAARELHGRTQGL